MVEELQNTASYEQYLDKPQVCLKNRSNNGPFSEITSNAFRPFTASYEQYLDKPQICIKKLQ